jgi:hypothetical protein
VFFIPLLYMSVRRWIARDPRQRPPAAPREVPETGHG